VLRLLKPLPLAECLLQHRHFDLVPDTCPGHSLRAMTGTDSFRNRKPDSLILLGRC